MENEAQQEYMKEMEQSIVDMQFVLDVTINKHTAKADAMIIHRSVVVPTNELAENKEFVDILTEDKKFVTKTVDDFDVNIKQVQAAMHNSDQHEKYWLSLSELILDMSDKLCATANGKSQPDFIIRPPQLMTKDDNLRKNKTQMLESIQKFEDALRTFDESKKQYDSALRGIGTSDCGRAISPDCDYCRD